jgi:hypothetical protein
VRDKPGDSKSSLGFGAKCTTLTPYSFQLYTSLGMRDLGTLGMQQSRSVATSAHQRLRMDYAPTHSFLRALRLVIKLDTQQLYRIFQKKSSVILRFLKIIFLPIKDGFYRTISGRWLA